MKLKSLSVLVAVLFLGACASVPPPPHCETGEGMQPINPEMLTKEQINRQPKASRESPSSQVGRTEQGGVN